MAQHRTNGQPAPAAGGREARGGLDEGQVDAVRVPLGAALAPPRWGTAGWVVIAIVAALLIAALVVQRMSRAPPRTTATADRAAHAAAQRSTTAPRGAMQTTVNH